MSSSPLIVPGRKQDPLLAPLQLKHLTLRNRIMSTSHAPFLEEGGLPLERYQRYHEEKAKGGIALTMFGGSSMVDADSSWGGSGQLDLSNDGIIAPFQQFSERIHRHGAALMCQISHLGRRADATSYNWLPSIAPSRSRETQHRAFSREMDEHDIRRIVKAYGAAAKRCLEGGLDGLETLTGGHLLGQFFSPRTNQRHDRFGGSLENRARFGLMVYEEIRRQVGEKMIVGIRFVIDEGIDDGLGFEEGIALAQLFQREGLVDYFNCIFGRMDTVIALAEQNMPGMASPSAPFLHNVGAFRREVCLPVFHAARIADLATARYAIGEGLLDMVAMTRAHMADPQLVNKLMRGEEANIRPCVGASYCMHKKVNCIHNPASGRETQLPQVIERSPQPSRKVLVIGAGPAGLEAARVAAERGHRVLVLEAGSQAGGQLLLAVRATWRRDLIGIVDWRVAELQRLGVEVRYDVYAGVEEVVAESPEVVIVATGGLPDLDWLEGAEHCLSIWDVLAGTAPVSGHYLLYDGSGRHEGVSTALHLAEQGAQVSLVGIDESLAMEMEYSSRAIYRKQYAQHGIDVTGDHHLIQVSRHAEGGLMATFRHELTGTLLERRADKVVVERGTAPLDEVFEGLRGMSCNDGVLEIPQFLQLKPQPMGGRDGFALYRIGDALSSRNVHAAMLDAMRLGLVL
ncbi:oxidoreductase [Pseudomonas sp. XS1P51]